MASGGRETCLGGMWKKLNLRGESGAFRGVRGVRGIWEDQNLVGGLECSRQKLILPRKSLAGGAGWQGLVLSSWKGDQLAERIPEIKIHFTYFSEERLTRSVS